MKLSKLFTTSLIALCLSISMTACSDDGSDPTDTNAGTDPTDDPTGDTGDTGDTATETGPSEDTDCPIFCVAYLEMCVLTNMTMELPNDTECSAACEAWDQDGKNCRYQQVIEGNCDQAGNMGDAC